MLRGDYDKQIELYYNRLYRKRRFRLYSLMVLALALVVLLGGLIFIKKSPISVDSVREKETVREIMLSEYGNGYNNRIERIAEINYDVHYESLRKDYIVGLNSGENKSGLDKKALEIAFFVEYVTDKSLKKAESYGYQEYSRKYYREYESTIEQEGSIKEMYGRIVKEHHKDSMDKGELKRIIELYDSIFSKGYTYLTSIGIKGSE